MSTLYQDVMTTINNDINKINVKDTHIVNPRETFYDEPWTPWMNDQDMIWSASFRQYNPMESLIRMYTLNTGFEDQNNYDPFQDENLESQVGEGNMWRFKDSGSSEETQYRIEKFKQDMNDLQYLANSNSGFESIVASLASPTTLAPLAPLRVMQSSSTMQRFLNISGSLL